MDCGVTQINKAIHELDQVTQENASVAEAVTTMSASLSAEAKSLQDTVGRLRADEPTKSSPSTEGIDDQVAMLRTTASSMRRAPSPSVVSSAKMDQVAVR